MQHRPVLIMAGGTGGHVYPALAVADYLHQRGIPLLWLGTHQGLEAQIVPEKGFQLLTFHISGLRGKGLFKWIQAPFTISFALIQAMLILIRRKPAAVLGMGGFVSGPGGVAAWLMRIPLCIHEQNAIAGLTNRLLAPLSRIVMEAFPGTFPPKLCARVTGNPVRAEILNLPGPEMRMQLEKNVPLKVLVLGGSQGAKTLNRIVPQAVASLPGDVRIEIRHQTGQKLYEETKSYYQGITQQVSIIPYIVNMAEVYIWADLVICRAGAITIAEISAVGLAAILVPFPHAVDDHQTANARYLSEQGGALLISEPEFTAEKLSHCLADFYNTRPRLINLARQARALAKPYATREVAELCLEVAYA